MKRLLTAWLFTLLLCGHVSAQLAGGLMFPGPGSPATSGGGGGFQGVVDAAGASAKVCYSLRACSAAARGTKAIKLGNHTGASSVDVLTDATTGDLAPPSGSWVIGGDDCSVLNTCMVINLYDQSGSNNCGGSPCDFGSLNSFSVVLRNNCSTSGKKCLSFDGASYIGKTNATTSTVINQTFTIAGVANRTPTSNTRMTFFSNNSDSFEFGFGATNKAAMYAPTRQDVSATDGTQHSLIGVFAGAGSSLIVDGSSTGTSPGTNAIAADDGLRVGLDGGGSAFFTGFWMETAVFSGTISTATVATNAASYW